MILGSGPNRIGQGIEFDYCCVHAAESFRAQGYEAVMVNCNPETVSTDYDTSDRLYFEPLDEEAVLAVLEREQPVGVCIQFGGQTPLKLARAIERAGFKILGTPFDAVDLAEDRERFGRLAESLGVRCPEWGMAETAEQAIEIAGRVGYPVLVRPSYVLGGRAMRVCYGEADMRGRDGRGRRRRPRRPLPRERDRARRRRSLRRHRHLRRGGDGARRGGRDPLRRLLVRAAGAVGLARDPRARSAASGPRSASSGCSTSSSRSPAARSTCSRSTRARRAPFPYASKATGINLVDAACRLAAGAALADLELPPEGEACAGHHVKAAVLPFVRFAGADPVLGPEMRSTGEVMASGADFATAFARAERAAGRKLPTGGRAFLSVRDADKVAVVAVARALAAHGFELVATAGTAAALELAEIAVERVEKGKAVVELVRSRGVDLVVNTPQGRNARRDGYAIREAAVVARVPCITTLAVARAAVEAIANGRAEEPVSLQERQAALPGREVLRAAS